MRQEKEAHGSDLETVHFVRMVSEEKKAVQAKHSQPQRLSDSGKVMVLVRKRPLFESEAKVKAFDVLSTIGGAGVWGGRVVMHEPRRKVDLTKAIENTSFDFDMVFDDNSANADVYSSTVTPLLEKMEHTPETTATVFAYGQTGSGKTYTISSFYVQAAEDVLALAERNGLKVSVRFFEIYGGRCFDLLSNRKQVQPLEDAKGQVNLHGLTNCPATHVMDIVEKVESGLRSRSTGSTSANEMSSRSHSLLELVLHGEAGVEEHQGKLALVDLAGSERGADRGADNGKTRHEGAEINKSLLALKECIRALYTNASDHVPFRGSRLTHILRDAFIGRNSHTVLLAHVSPSSASAEHSLNTLRYAYRIKESPSLSEEKGAAFAGAAGGNERGPEAANQNSGKKQQQHLAFQNQQAQAAKAAATARGHQQQQQAGSNATDGGEQRQRAQWKLAGPDDGSSAESNARESKPKEQLKRHKRQSISRGSNDDGGNFAMRFSHQDGADETDSKSIPQPRDGAASGDERDGPSTPVRALQDQPATSAIASRLKHDNNKEQLKHRRRSQEKAPTGTFQYYLGAEEAHADEMQECDQQHGDGERATNIGESSSQKEQKGEQQQRGGRWKRPQRAWNGDRGAAGGSKRQQRHTQQQQQQQQQQLQKQQQGPPSPDGLQERAAKLREHVSMAIEHEKEDSKQESVNGTKHQMMSEWLKTSELKSVESHTEAASKRKEVEHELLESHSNAIPQLQQLAQDEMKLLEKTAAEKRRGEADLSAYVTVLERIIRWRRELDEKLNQQASELKQRMNAEAEAEEAIQRNLFKQR